MTSVAQRPNKFSLVTQVEARTSRQDTCHCESVLSISAGLALFAHFVVGDHDFDSDNPESAVDAR
jgi:hypothetical protein